MPIGVQSFEEIRSGEYIYVDKTRYVFDLISSGKYYFLSRPRRFGKSLLVDTMRCLFEGRKELFEGLYIYDKWDWKKEYSVIRIDFGEQKSTNAEELVHYIQYVLKDIGNRSGIEVGEDYYYIEFQKLIRWLYEKYEGLRNKIILVGIEFSKEVRNIVKYEVQTI
ncbi:MAG: hypothetical protein KatS3mg027_1589 [Bacteroidia bacterium]|nr:MAG: hypothetical protein KatS3mg027_1589 [Bacteroidia bacterium]